MAVSLDGKIAPPSRERFRLGGSADLGRMEDLRAWADVIVVGGGTVRAEDPPFALPEERARRRREIGRPPHPAVVIVSATLDLPPGRVFTGPNRTIIATTREAPDPPGSLPGRVELWRLGTGRVALPELVGRLRGERLESILVEGGGGLAAGFFESDLVAELYLTITPWMIGGDAAPGICEAGHLLPEQRRFRLEAIERGPDEVFLIYHRH